MKLKVGVIIFLLVLGGMGIYVFQSESLVRGENYSVEGNMLSVALEGYEMTCMPNKTVYTDTDGGWQEVDQTLPGKGGYYLDNEFIGYGMCDVRNCLEITRPIVVSLSRYEQKDMRKAPEGRGFSGEVPAFVSVPLEGKIRATINYYSDPSCLIEKTSHIDIER